MTIHIVKDSPYVVNNGLFQLCGCGICDKCISGFSTPAVPVIKHQKKRTGKRRTKASSQARRKIKKSDGVCRYCMVRPPQTIDHVIPRSRGGTNKQLNLVACCHRCNQEKGDRTPKEAGLTLHVPLRFFQFDSAYLNQYARGVADPPSSNG